MDGIRGRRVRKGGLTKGWKGLIGGGWKGSRGLMGMARATQRSNKPSQINCIA